MAGTSSRQVVTRGVEEVLFLRVLDPITGVNLSVTGSNHEVRLYNNQGGLVETILSGSAFSVSDTNLLQMKHSFQESLYPLANYNRAWWKVHLSGTGGGSIFREYTTYFSVVRRRFTPQLSVTEMTARHPYLAAQIPSGHSLASYLQRAWERITLTLWKRTDTYAGNIFHSEDFSLAHEYLTLAEFFLSIAFSADPRDEDMKKYELYTQKGLDFLEVAASKIAIDLNEDGIFSKSEERFLSSIRVVR
jgi:hypothetical protein